MNANDLSLPILGSQRLVMLAERQFVERLRYGNSDVGGGIGEACSTLVWGRPRTILEGGDDSQLDSES
jgi:hypothetical protein